MKFKYLYIVILLLSLISITIVDAAEPVADFTSNVTIQTVYPMVVQFNDTSSNSPTTWNWSFGDGTWFNTTNVALSNATYTYAAAGKYTVNLTVNNTDGSNTKSVTEYINLTSDNDDNLTIWLHMNGTNGSTTFLGEKGVAWTNGGAAYISTNRYKYGGASGAFTGGANSYISAATNPAFNFSTNDFTIELWVNTTTIDNNNDHVISKTRNQRDRGWGLDCGGNDNNWGFWMGNNSRGQVFFNAPIPSKTWTHLTIERRSGTIYLYINGNLTNSSTGFNTNYDVTEPVWIGRQAGEYYNGFVDELRITNNLARWTSNFTPPQREYSGTLETIYPDINPYSTFRWKTTPPNIAYIDNVSQGGTRNRTLQIENITNTSYVTGQIRFNPLYVQTQAIRLNTTYFPTGLVLISSSYDNDLGIVEFNITRNAGFNVTAGDRASILDYQVLYYNFSNYDTSVYEYFGAGQLINNTTGRYYPVHYFNLTQVTYGDWNFTANFTASNLTVSTGTVTTFVSTFNGSYPNRWNWNFGDGTFNNGTNWTVSHTYTTGGLKTVSLTEYMWQNDTIYSVAENVDYINVTDTLPIADFTSSASGSTVPVTVDFTDTSINYPTVWNWTFGDGNTSPLQNPTHIYETCGNFTVGLRSGNSIGWSAWNNKTNHVSVTGCGVTPTPTPTSTIPTENKLAIKVMDTQNLITIGVIIIIISGLVAFAVSFILKK